MAVRRVEHHGVDVLGDQRLHAVHRVGRNADAGRHAQAALRVLAGIGVILHLGDVLISDQPHQTACVVHHGELFDLAVEQYFLGVGEFGIVRRHEAVAGRHHLLDAARHVALETQVAVGDDADKHPVRIHDRNASDLVLFHQVQRVADGVVLGNGHRIVDHAVLGALHLADLRGLLGDGHVLVDHADSSFPRQGDGQRRFGYRVHGGGHNGDVERDISRETGLNIDLSRQHFRIGGYKQHIVEGKSLGLNPFIDKRHNERGFLLLANVVFFFETA